jgi:hypothetical protein
MARRSDTNKETGGKIVSDILDFAHILDRARDSERGLVLSTATEGKAINLAQRLNRFRRQERSESRKIYSPDHPSFGKSPWDTLRVKAEGREVVIDKLGSDVLEIKEL